MPMPACNWPSALYATPAHRRAPQRSRLLIAIEQAWRLVAGDIDIGPAIVIEIRCDRAQTVTSPAGPELAAPGSLLRMPALAETSVKVPSPLL